MLSLAVTVFAVAVALFVCLSRWLDQRQISAPMVFTLFGAVVGANLSEAELKVTPIQALTETTLALILFHDAAQVRPDQLRRDAGISLRLLLIGLPLTVLAGFLSARVMFPGVTVWLCLFVASALAPTDAGLGAATVLNPAVPARVRRVLNVESGLNDGLMTPVVLLSIAAMAAPSVADEAALPAAVHELVLGVLIGTVSGAGVGLLLTRSGRRGLVAPGLVPVAALVTPLLAYYGSAAAGGNGFVAAFVSGTAFATAYRSQPASGRETTDEQEETREEAVTLTESLSTVLAFAVWTTFGALAVPHLWRHLTWQGAAFAVLSLTLFRMVPVALALIGTQLAPRTVLFIGWFGPRGLASVVFALIAVESLPADGPFSAVLATVELTVLLSVVLHGATAEPWARRYGAWARHERPAVEMRS